MMNNLFMIFDPSTSVYFSMNWIVLMWVLLLSPYTMFILKNRMMFINLSLMIQTCKEIKNNMTNMKFKSLVLLISFFYMILFMNSLSLTPFMFTASAHLTFSLFFSMPIWISLMIKGWMIDTTHMLTHLVPLNSPLVLSPFMVLIETISNLIRPLTLAIRLSANMISGHILISLLSSMLNINIYSFFLTSLIMILLMILEISVSIIQAFVLITLLSLYMNEI